MKLSQNSKTILSNFSLINSGILLKVGNILRTVDGGQTILAEAELDENIPTECAIFNLQKFLKVGNLFDEPEFVFGEDEIVISDNSQKVKYRTADQALITTPPDKGLTLPDAVASFTLTEQQLDKIKNASVLLELGYLSIESTNGKLSLTLDDLSNPDSDSFQIATDIVVDSEFKAVLDVGKLLILPGSYDVEITQKAAFFKSKTLNVKYWIALDTASKFPA
jgi:hypothetical protein